MELSKRNKRIVIAVMAITLASVFVFSAVQYSGVNFSSAARTTPVSVSSVIPKQIASSGGSTGSGNNIFSSPNYTGGTYVQACTLAPSPDHLNVLTASSLYDFMLLDEVYDSLYTTFPNESIGPWLATSGYEANLAGLGVTTFDPITGQMANVNYAWVVNLTPGVKWQDWTSSNAGNTYTFSNYTSFNNATGVSFNYTYKQFYNPLTGKNQSWTPETMKTYYVQSADVILSWKLLFDSTDFSGTFLNVVNAVPINNLTVAFYLSSQNALFLSSGLETPILPYHIWVSHDYASAEGLWNYTSSLPASDSYNGWGLGYNSVTGYAPGLVGSGPYMMYAGFGQPAGALIQNDYWKLYVNPDYFVQYVPSLSKWAPRMDEIETQVYSTPSAEVSALLDKEVSSILEIAPTFIPTIKTIPNTYIYHKSGTGYGYQQANSYSANAPFNITMLRQALEYAIPKSYLASVVAEGYSLPGPSTVVPDSDSAWQDSEVAYYHFSLSKAAQTINATINETHGQLSYSSTALAYFSPGGTLYYLGKPVTTSIQITSAAQDPLGVEGAQIIASDWDKLGISTSVKEESFAAIVAALVGLTPASPDTYSVINLGITGIEGNPAIDFLAFETTLGIGTGFYLGPFTNMTYNGPTSSAYPGLVDGHTYNGTQVTNTMNNLTFDMVSSESITSDHFYNDAIQWIQAYEATFENLGYSVTLVPITNSTFTGITKDNLPIGAYWYWNFFTLHKRVTALPVVPVTLKLSVGIISNAKIYYDGQYGNLTIQVRDQFGSAMPNIPVTIGYSPTGALLNISSYSGTTNAAGIYSFEFQVLFTNSLIYTADYEGEITFTVSALPTTSTEEAGIATYNIDVSPYAIEYSQPGTPVLYKGMESVFRMTIYNPLTGNPVSGYAYTIQSLAGALEIAPAISGQSFQQVASPFLNVPYNSTYNVTTMDQVSGVTGSNGTIAVIMQANESMNFTLNGAYFETYLFIGDYAAGAPVGGEGPYMTLGELTSATNPNGFGVAQPYEVPIIVTNQTSAPNISLSFSSHSVAYNGTVNVTVKVTSNNGTPLSDFPVVLTAQNALGANRGFFIQPGGVTDSAFNPNSFFGSEVLPMISLTTNSAGYAYATFYPTLYSFNSATGAFTPLPYSDQWLVPFDEFEIGAFAMNSTVMSGTSSYISSTPFVFNNVTTPFIAPIGAIYMQNVSVVNGQNFVLGNSTHSAYINTTFNVPAGPTIGSVGFSVSASAGVASVTSATTATNGTYVITYTAPNVSSITAVTITISTTGTSSPMTYTYSFFVVPVYTHTVTTTKTVTQTVTKTPFYDYAIMGVLAALFVAFAALYAVAQRKKK